MPTFVEILTTLKRQIAATVAAGSVNRFYIGRSVDVEARLGEHGADEIRPLYETQSLTRALDIEDELIKHFYNHPKNDNWQEHAGGNVAEGRQHIYVALWFAP